MPPNQKSLRDEVRKRCGQLSLGIEKYFRAIGIEDDATKVNSTAIYFIDVTLLWWCHRSTDEKQGGSVIRTWQKCQVLKRVQKAVLPTIYRE